MNTKLLVTIIFTASIFISSTLFAAEKTKIINYANNYAEFSVSLPEAPSVRTIWADNEKEIPYISYLKEPQKTGAIGEVAIYENYDNKNNDLFMTEITFLKVDSQFIEKANEATLLSIIKRDLSYLPSFDNIITKYDDTINKPAKHAIVTGTAMRKDGTQEFNAVHFLVGTQSILVIKLKFNSNNEKHYDIYKNMEKSIKYLPL